MITSIKKVEEIDHLLIQDPVDQVPDRSAENQNQPNPNHFIFRRRLMKKYQNSNNSDNRKSNEQVSFVLRRPIRTQTKRHSRISNVCEREKIIDHHYEMMFRNMGIDPHLGVLIQDDQDIGSQK